jgi:hypothetical protein
MFAFRFDKGVLANLKEFFIPTAPVREVVCLDLPPNSRL